MKRAFLTGGSRGLGLTLCQNLLNEGWQVATVSRAMSPELETLLARNDRLQYLPLDLANRDEVDAFCQSDFLSDLDAFISNAAVGLEGLLTLTPPAEIERCIQVNLTAPIILAREAVKGMLNRGGSLVFISSVAANNGLAGLSTYSATKGALISFSKAIAREYGERGIRANCILPGFLDTEMSRSLPATERARVERRSALKRLGQPDDVVGAVQFLLSEQARFITGTEIVVDGGFSV